LASRIKGWILHYEFEAQPSKCGYGLFRSKWTCFGDMTKTKFYGKYGISAIISDFADNPTLMKYS